MDGLWFDLLISDNPPAIDRWMDWIGLDRSGRVGSDGCMDRWMEEKNFRSGTPAWQGSLPTDARESIL